MNKIRHLVIKNIYLLKQKWAIFIKCHKYSQLYSKRAFYAVVCNSEKQYEALITCYYHAIEKGLSYINYRPGFGKDTVASLLETMEGYLSKGYDPEGFCFSTAVSVLKKYVEKNEEYGIEDLILEEKIRNLGIEGNDKGGVLRFDPLVIDEIQQLDYKSFVNSRRSIRTFSEESVDIGVLKKAIQLAQKTPSSCNRQPWQTIIVCDMSRVKQILENQNGNAGFGDKIEKLLLITVDLECFNAYEELFQPYIDGGMYALSVLNALHYYGIASIPLSAALSDRQEKMIRKYAKMSESEKLILIIGVGKYPEFCITPRSERHEANIRLV